MSVHIFCWREPPKALAIHNEDGVFPINRIFCVGRNYAAHAAEMGNEVDKQTPFYFTVSPVNASNGGDVRFLMAQMIIIMRLNLLLLLISQRITSVKQTRSQLCLAMA